MVAFSVSVKGEKELLKSIKYMSNPNKLFDKDVKKTAITSQRELIEKTNRQTGTTARSWQLKKIKASFYINFNDVMTEDQKHLIVNILNDGRKKVLPKPPNTVLYIPLTEKGRSFEGDFGLDWIYVKSAKATTGTKFLEKEEKRAIEQLVSLMLKRIGSV